MRRIFSICILVLAVLVVTQFFASSTASAQDVWAYGNEDGQTYVMTETIINSPEEVSVKVKNVRDNGRVDIFDIWFIKSNMTWVGQVGTGTKNLGPIFSNPYATAIWNVVSPLL